MKKIKNFAIALIAIALVGSLVSCAFKPNAEQKAAYDDFITAALEISASGGMSADEVKIHLEQANDAFFKAMEFKVVDTQAGQALEKGTSRADLEKRFKPAKL